MKAALDAGCATCPATCTTCPLDCLTEGCHASVISITGDCEFRRRLLEMGFCNSARVELVRRAPFGDPIEFHLRGYYVSLRAEQARNVLVSVMAKAG